ncbi:MAG: hypothetical protein ABI790_13665, partial [Betaproteobacteria bacterium]
RRRLHRHHVQVHTPDPRRAFTQIARRVKPGGRLSVWLYRKNTFPQELVNSGLLQIDYDVNGAPNANVFDFKQGFRKVKSTHLTYGYKSNLQPPNDCTAIAAPTEPTDPAYTKPTVMQPVPIKLIPAA